MNLYKVVFGFGFTAFVRALCGLAVVKILALYLGPAEFGLIGQLMTVVAITSMFAGGGVTNGLIKNISEAASPALRQRKLGAAMKIFIAASLISSIILILCSGRLSVFVFARSDLAWVFVLLAFSQWLVGFYNIAQALFSCLHDVKTLICINVIGAVFGVVIFAFFIVSFRFDGAALGLVVLPMMTGVVALITWWWRIPSSWRTPDWSPSWPDIKNLLTYSGVMLVAVTAVPCAQMLIRDMIGDTYGWNFAGYWQGILKISDVYMQFVGMLLANYALPRFSNKKTPYELRREVFRLCLFLAIIMMVLFVLIYCLRRFVITLLFSSDFLSMEQLFLPQLCGDLLRVIASIFVYLALSRGSRIIPIFSEVIQASGLLVFTWALLPWFQAAAPVYAHVITYALLLAFMLVVCRLMEPRWFAMSNTV